MQTKYFNNDSILKEGSMTGTVSLKNNKSVLLTICYKENNEPKSLILKPYEIVDHVDEKIYASQHCKELIKAGAVSITAKHD